jgi:acyl-coenzyme A synthetase/AMP-(fatty) acid ligase
LPTSGAKALFADASLALEAHPAVLEAAVFGLPDPEFGESVQPVVQLRDPSQANDGLAQALHAQVRATLAAYKAPRRVAFEDDLPRLPNGKLEKHHPRDAWRARADRGFAPAARRNVEAPVSSAANRD